MNQLELFVWINQNVIKYRLTIKTYKTIDSVAAFIHYYFNSYLE